MKTVYWQLTLGDTIDQSIPIDYIDPPERFAKNYDMGYEHAKCPAWKEYGKNLSLIHI